MSSFCRRYSKFSSCKSSEVLGCTSEVHWNTSELFSSSDCMPWDIYGTTNQRNWHPQSKWPRVLEVIAMLNQDFIKWVAIAFVIACSVAWVAMHKWLENFAYKTEMSWWVFALAGVMALFIALLTVSWQSWRAATRNPVESLRYE